MTEDEAKTKWCPAVRLTASAGEWNTNRSPDLPSRPDDTQAYRCIASACMAWRPGTTSKFKDGRSGRLVDRDLTGHGEWIMVGGYCGLAGQPQ